MRSIWKRRLKIAALVAGVLAVAVLVYVHTPAFRHLVERRLENILGERIGRDVRVQLASLRPLTLRARIAAIRIAGRTPEATPFVELADSSVDARWRSLLGGRIHLSNLALGGLRVDLDQLPVASAPDDEVAEGAPPSFGQLMQLVVIDRGIVSDARLHATEPGARVNLDIDGIRIALDRSSEGERYRAVLEIADGTVRIADRGELTFEVEAETDLAATGVTVNDLALRGDGVELRATAAFEDPFRPAGTTEFELELRPEQLPASILAGLPIRGAVRARGTARVDLVSYDLDLELTADGLTWNDWIADSITVRFTGSDRTWDSTFAAMVSDVALEGEVHAAPPPVLVPLRTRAKFSTADVDSVIRVAAGPDATRMRGPLHGQLEARLDALELSSLGGTFELVSDGLGPRSEPGVAVPSRVTGSVDHGRLTVNRLEAAGAGFAINARGTAGLDDSSELELGLDVDDAGPALHMARLVLDAFGVDSAIPRATEAARGRIELTTELRGPGLRDLAVDALAGKVSLRAEGFKASGRDDLPLDADVRASIGGGSLKLRELALRAPDLRLDAEGDLGATGLQGLAFVAEVDDVGRATNAVLEEFRALGLLTFDWPSERTGPVTGTLHLEGTLDGPWNAVSGNVVLRGDRVAVADGPSRSLSADASIDRGRVVARAGLTGDGSDLSLDLRTGPYVERPLHGVLDVAVSEPSPTWWLDFAGFSLEVDGRLEGTATVELESLTTRARLDVTEGSWAGLPFDLHNVDVTVSPERVVVDEAELVALGGRATLHGTLGDDDAPAAISVSPDQGLRIRGEGFDLGAALRLAEVPVDAEGSLGFDGRITGTPSAPDIEARLTLAGLLLEGLTLPDLDGPVSYESGRWAVDLEKPDGSAHVRAGGRLNAAAPWTLDVRYPLRLDLRELAALPEDLAEFNADGELRLQLEGAAGDPAKLLGDVEVRDLRVRLGEQEFTAQDGPTIRFANGEAQLTPIDLAGGDSRLSFGGKIDLAAPYTLSAQAVGDLALAPFSSVAAPARIGGTAAVDVRVTGPANEPTWTGVVQLRDGRFAHPDVQAPVEQIEASLRLDPERWQLEELSMRLGGGPVRGSGEYVASGPAEGTVRLELDGDGVRLRLLDGLRAEADARLRLDGSIEEVLTLSGRLDVARAAYEQDIKLEEQLLAKSRESGSTSGVGGILDRVRLDVALEAAGGSYVRNNIATAETSLSLRVGGTVDEPRLTGRCNLVEGGRLFFRGVTYSITRGSVAYVDDPPENPTLDIEAETSVSSYDITLRATGRLEDPQIELSSSPSLPQADIVSLLLTGKTRDALSASGGGLSSTQAALYLTRNWTKGLENTLKRTLGIDQLRIDPVLIEGDAEPTARVTVGKTLTGRTSATYSRALSGTQDDIYELRYEPRERVSLVGRSDEESELSGAVQYTRKFYVGPPRPPTDSSAGSGGRRITRVSVEGNRSIGTRRLRRDLKQSKGDRYRRAVLLDGLDAIRDRYLRHGFPEAHVDADMTEESDGVAVQADVEEGRRVRVRFEGLGRRRRGLQRQVLTLWQRSVFLDTVVVEAAERVRDRLRSEGFTKAEVEAEAVELDSGIVELHVAVDRGPRVRVERIVVTGNRAVDEARIRGQMLTEEAGLLTRGRLSPAVLEQDRAAILGLLVGLGYLDADVGEPEVSFPESDDRARVLIEVDEGRRYHLRRITFSGNELLKGSALDKIVTLRQGAPFVDRESRAARSSLRRAYDRAGYPEVRVEIRPQVDRVAGVVDLELVVDEGPHKIIESVEVAGTALTRPSVVRREVDVEPGDPLSADAVATTRQNLYRTGLFKSVGVSEETGATEDGRDLQFRVEEAPNVRTDYGLGYSTDDHVRAGAKVSHLNLFGRRLYASTGGRISATDWRAFVLARKPRLLGTRLNGLTSAFAEEEEEDAFDVRRTGLTLQVGRRTRQERLGWFVGYGLEEVDVIQEGIELDPGSGVPPDFDDVIDLREESIFRLGNVNAGFLFGNRDDFAWPTRGSVLQSKLSVYDEGLASEVEFVRGFTQWTFHRKLGSRLIWNSGVRLGLIEPYGTADFVPISERFFAGGDSSIRGYETDSIVAVGFPSDELAAAGITFDESQGGNALFVVNQELVTPLIDPLSAAFFYDAGNVYWLVDDIDATDLRHSAGVGLRLRTPIGPLRLEYGWKLDRERDEARGRVHFSIGLAF